MNKFQSLILEKVSFKMFLLSATVLSIFGDFIHCYYAKLVWFTFPRYQMISNQALMVQGIDKNLLAPNELLEIQSMVYQFAWTMLAGLMALNFIFYLLFLNQKKWGIKYTLIIASTSLILCIITFFFQLKNPDIWTLATLVQIFIYLYVYLGIKGFPEFKSLEQ